MKNLKYHLVQTTEDVTEIPYVVYFVCDIYKLKKNPYLENFYGFNFSSVSYMGAFAKVNEWTTPIMKD